MTTRNPDRANRRKEQYRIARETYGYSSKEASRLRDLSFKAFHSEIIKTEQRIKKKSPKRRTDFEVIQLQRIQQAKQLAPTPRRRDTRAARQAQFNLWSGQRDFPYVAQEFITKQNRLAGKADRDSFGYRIYYWHYVNELDVSEAVIAAERKMT